MDRIFDYKVQDTVIRLVCGDITRDHGVEAIVNAANTTLLGGGGVDGAIHRRAGPGLLQECRTLNGCPTGMAKITGAYSLPCRYVIHTPGPVWRGGGSGESGLLASCYRSCLDLARENGIRTVAFSSISTGAYGYPPDQASKVAVSTVAEYLGNYPGSFDLVMWVLYSDGILQIYRNTADSLI